MEEEAIGDDDAEVTVNKVEEEMIVCITFEEIPNMVHVLFQRSRDGCTGVGGSARRGVHLGQRGCGGANTTVI